MRTSYSREDVILLLKDITGMVAPQPAEEREKLIQSGKHYCEMLPVEYVPTERYMEIYREAFEEVEPGQFTKRIFALDKKVYRHF